MSNTLNRLWENVAILNTFSSDSNRISIAIFTLLSLWEEWNPKLPNLKKPYALLSINGFGWHGSTITTTKKTWQSAWKMCQEQKIYLNVNNTVYYCLSDSTPNIYLEGEDKWRKYTKNRNSNRSKVEIESPVNEWKKKKCKIKQTNTCIPIGLDYE